MSATEHVSAFSVCPASTPAVEISQVELALLLSLRSRLSQLETQVASAEESIKLRLQQGAGVEQGNHTVTLKISTSLELR